MLLSIAVITFLVIFKALMDLATKDGEEDGK